jgi:hypothetical protein
MRNLPFTIAFKPLAQDMQPSSHTLPQDMRETYTKKGKLASLHARNATAETIPV